ncbi:hypothetical protein DFQ28_009070 [Apophysomyces sp. BC1034]|nr:hypothetical protein DFQ30_009049 [Apophysomyces sp. BC1015]KAG0180812.1 hypothetical protein DFQ29_010075 [Apophysomyces sp. BC1021]KAG0192459.1 hypothetical protein DFQ28_009070 [Apophysomyces sp. BC1034]
MTTAAIPQPAFEFPSSSISPLSTPQEQPQQQQLPDNDQKKKKKKIIRQAVGAVIIDSTTKKVLMLSSRKRENALVLPRGECETDTQETPENATIRVLLSEAGVSVSSLTQRVGTFTEANKKGKIIAHHWMYEVHDPTLVDTWAGSDRKRVWVTLNEALTATTDRRMAHLALNSCSLARHS